MHLPKNLLLMHRSCDQVEERYLDIYLDYGLRLCLMEINRHHPA